MQRPVTPDPEPEEIEDDAEMDEGMKALIFRAIEKGMRHEIQH